MADQGEAPEAETTTQDLRGKLITRLAVAGGLVAVLLGVLAFFDYLANPPEEMEAPVFTKPIPVAPRKEVSQPVTPTEALPEPPAPVAADPVVEPPPPPVVEEQPSARVEAATRSGGQARPAPASALGAPKRQVSPSAPIQSVPEATSAPNNVVPARPAAAPAEPEQAKPAEASREARPPPAVLPPSGAARLFSGFLLQAGVFSSAQRAEELYARLNQSGVRATLETRVQVGPFRTRQEAEAAQAKLKQLGVETIIVPPKGKSH